MDTTKTIVLEFKLTRNRLLGLLSFLLLTWHPGFLGSEVLTLTTYYPAPYGGYVSLLTTSRTLLARDGGGVLLGGNSGATPAASTTGSNPVAVKLDIRGGGIELEDLATIHSKGRMHIDGEEKLYLLNNNGVIVSKLWGGNGNLTVEGTLNFGDVLKGFCEWIPYNTVGGGFCNANERVIGYYGNGVGQITGYLPASKTSEGGGTWISLGEDWNGTMICCRFAPLP